MPTYSVAFRVHATKYITVKADSEEEARFKAENKAEEPNLCWSCANEVEIDCLGEVISVEKTD